MCVCSVQVVEEDEAGVTVTMATRGGGKKGMRELDLGDLADEEAVARLMRDLEGAVKGME